jgi:dTDP-glucose 4,6-dehydratase
MQHILVTGGLGFIGVNLLKHLSQNQDLFIHNIDNLSLGTTHFDKIVPVDSRACIKTYFDDVNNQDLVSSILRDHDIRQVYHLAAESHVDRSISGPRAFYNSNVMGTLSMVEACRDHIEQTGITEFRFLHVSTDEVFGDLSQEDPPFSEGSMYHPNSPYSASKAASDFIIKSWHRTFGFPGIVTNCSNNFGPGQNAEKLIPTIVNALAEGRRIPIYGTGQNIRDWLFVDTHVAYLRAVMAGGTPGQSYLIGGNMEMTNLDLVKKIHQLFNVCRPDQAKDFEDVFEFVTDRKGHDFRYAIDTSQVRSQFPDVDAIPFGKALKETVDFYLGD